MDAPACLQGSREAPGSSDSNAHTVFADPDLFFGASAGTASAATATATASEGEWEENPSEPGYHFLPTPAAAAAGGEPARAPPLSAADHEVMTGMRNMGYQVCDKRTLEPCDTLSPSCLGGGAFGLAYAAVNTVEGDHYAV